MPIKEEVAAKLPPLRTRDVLLVLDLQNDFVSMNAQLPISHPFEYVDRIAAMIPKFREQADVIWVRSHFEGERPFNTPDGERVILVEPEQKKKEEGAAESSRRGRGPQSRKYAPSVKALELLKTVSAKYSEIQGIDGEDDEICEETFLSKGKDGKEPQCCKPGSFGAKFFKDIEHLIDSSKDTILTKTYYSAFNSTGLLQALRSNLVVNIYICGVISNISVFATAVDAARHGFSVTLVENCLGYKTKASHNEAMRVMTEELAIETISSAALVQELAAKPATPAKPKSKREAYKQAAESSRPPNLDDPQVTLEDVKSTSKDANKDKEKQESTPLKSPTKAVSSIPKRPTSSQSASPVPKSPSPKLPGSPALGEKNRVQRLPIRKARQAPDQELEKKIEPPKLAEITEPEKKTVTPESGPGSSETKAVTPLVAAHAGPRKSKQKKKQQSQPPLRPGDKIGEGDCRVIYDVLSENLEKDIFQKLKEEVRWRAMYHRGGEVPRLVAVEGEVDKEGSFPIYRHPADESPPLLPFSPTVALIRNQVQKVLRHPLNHVLIQLYRSGQDYISEHSDKTLDIVRGSNIVNISLGAQRTMTLRTKKSTNAQEKAASSEAESRPESPVATIGPDRRDIQRILMPHNSMFVLGQRSNMKWLHAVKQDKRPDFEKSPEELAYKGERISLTFRHIGTFVNSDITQIWGQGAVSKMKEFAGDVINGETESEQMIFAFGRENHASNFDWDHEYGAGFDVINFVVSRLAKLSTCSSSLTGLRLELLLAEKGIPFDKVEQAASPCKALHKAAGGLAGNERLNSKANGGGTNFCCFSTKAKFVDSDTEQTEIEGELAILLYLELSPNYKESRFLASAESSDAVDAGSLAKSMTALDRGLQLSQLLAQGTTDTPKNGSTPLKDLVSKICEVLEKAPYLSGEKFGLADVASWPALSVYSSMSGAVVDEKLGAYLKRVYSREVVKDVLSRYEQLAPKLD